MNRAPSIRRRHGAGLREVPRTAAQKLGALALDSAQLLGGGAAVFIALVLFLVLLALAGPDDGFPAQVGGVNNRPGAAPRDIGMPGETTAPVFSTNQSVQKTHTP